MLARVFVYLPSFFSQNLDFVYWTVLIFILIHFEWRDTENQQLMSVDAVQTPHPSSPHCLLQVPLKVGTHDATSPCN